MSWPIEFAYPERDTGRRREDLPFVTAARTERLKIFLDSQCSLDQVETEYFAGDNSSGQASVPAGLSGVVAISAGWNHSLALKSDGTVVAWGDNTDGQASVPAGLTGVIAIAAGGIHSLALKKDGTVVAWGDNTDGQASVPAGLSGVVAIAAGGQHSLAMVTL